MAPHPMTGVLIRSQNLDTGTHLEQVCVKIKVVDISKRVRDGPGGTQ